MAKTEIITVDTSLFLTEGNIENILNTKTEEEIIAIIVGINGGENYWSQEQKMMLNPQPNLSPRTWPSYRMQTFDVHREEKLFEPFAEFLLKAVAKFSHLVLYVHDGEFGFSPVFAVRYLNKELESPYLIKFKEKHFPKTLYRKMITALYSKGNTNKYLSFGLEKIRSLESYEY